MDGKTHNFFLIYNVECKHLYGSKHLRVIFDKVNGYIGESDRTKFLGLLYFDGKYEKI